MKSLIGKIFNYETVSYVIVGILTTLVDYAVFAVVNEMLKAGGVSLSAAVSLATVISWIAAVVFAYVANKFLVFKSFGTGLSYVAGEFASFISARVLSGVISLLIVFLLVVRGGVNEYIAKIITSVFNLAFNYAASKFFIFKK